jgi:monoterpene epsilon-lactone hydrolase
MEYVLQFRESYDQRPHPYDNEPSVSITQVMIRGVNCYWFTPEDPSPDRIVIYVHGGGFAAGSFKTHGKMVSHFAKELHTAILFIDYALAPENPYPAGLHDILTVYRELADRYPGSHLDLIGDSAGGSLVISAIGEMLNMHHPEPEQWSSRPGFPASEQGSSRLGVPASEQGPSRLGVPAPEQGSSLPGFPLPDAVVLISPWIDLECDTLAIEENAQSDLILNKDMLQLFAQAYTGDVPFEVSSPKRASLTQFPPVLIMVGSNEILLGDSRYFYEEIKRIQRKTRLTIYDDQQHLWPKKDINKEASRRALAEIAEFIRQ